MLCSSLALTGPIYSFSSDVVLDGVAALRGAPGMCVSAAAVPGPLWRAANAQNGAPTEK